MKILHVGWPQLKGYASGVRQGLYSMAMSEIAAGLEVGMLPLPSTKKGEPVELPGGCRLRGPQKIQLNPWFVSREWISRISNEFGVPDIVHFHSIYIPFNSALARRCREAGWPYVVTTHGGLSRVVQKADPIKKGLANLLCFRSYLKHAAAIHAFSDREAKLIQDDFDVKKVIVAPNGVDERLFNVPETLPPADLGDFGRECDLMLGFVGRVDVYYKGLDLLLEAMTFLRPEPGGPRYKLFIVGSFGSEKDKKWLYSTLDSLRLKETVKFLGPKYDEEVIRHFLACDVFVHPSRTEGMPMAVLEAMALGRPCLVTPGTNLADVVSEAGGWVTEAEPGAIAESIRRICKSRSSLPAVGRKLQNLARSKFNWCKIAKQLKEEYIAICKQNT